MNTQIVFRFHTYYFLRQGLTPIAQARVQWPYSSSPQLRLPQAQVILPPQPLKLLGVQVHTTTPRKFIGFFFSSFSPRNCIVLHFSERIICIFLVEMGFPHVAQRGLKLLGSSNPPALASRSAEIKRVSHHAWLNEF